MRVLAVAILLGWMVVPCAEAQVAAPSIFPPMPRVLDPVTMVPQTTMLPENPAAMEWGPTIALGAAYLDSERSVNSESSEYAGNFVGFVGRSFAITYIGAVINMSGDELKTSLTKTGASVGIADVLAFGIGNDVFRRSLQGTDRDVLSRTLGTSIRISGLYLGVARQQDELAQSFASTINDDDRVKISASRTQDKAGIGLLLGERAKSQLHLESYRVEAHPYLINGATFEDGVTNAVVLEVKTGPAIGGAKVFSFEETSAAKLNEGVVVDVGWERVEGIASYIHYEVLRTTFTNDPTHISNTTYALVIAYRF